MLASKNMRRFRSLRVQCREDICPALQMTHTAIAVTPCPFFFRWMNGQHLRALPVEELAPKVGEALVEGGVCKDADGAFAKGAAALLQGSLELVGDVVGQAQDVMGYNVSMA